MSVALIKRITTNYSLRIPNWDMIGWGREMERNMDIIDGVMFAATGIGSVRGVWANATLYGLGDRVIDSVDGRIYQCLVVHTSAASGTFSADRILHPTYWEIINADVHNRGQWTTATAYNENEFVMDANRFGIVLVDYTSGASYNADVAGGKIETLIDMSPYVTNGVGQSIAAAPSKATLVDADKIGVSDSAASNNLVQWSFANLKTQLSTLYLDQASNLSDIVSIATAKTNLQALSYAASQGLSATEQLNARNNIRVMAPEQPKNFVINGNGSVAQHGASGAGLGYTSLDMWYNNFNGGTQTLSQQFHTLGQAVVPGFPKWFIRSVFTSVANAANYSMIQQPIEDVTKLGGKTITVSFWARCASGTRNMAVELSQNFGTGGSPSADVTGIGAQLVALTTTFQKFSLVINMTSITGKTLGSGNNDLSRLCFWFEAGANFNARTASLGQGGGSGTVEISNVTINEGDTTGIANPYLDRSFHEELELCQRYFTVGSVRWDGLASNGVNHSLMISFPASMRTTPTIALGNTLAVSFPATPSTVFVSNQNHMGIGRTANASAAGAFADNFSASSELV